MDFCCGTEKLSDFCCEVCFCKNTKNVGIIKTCILQADPMDVLAIEILESLLLWESDDAKMIPT